ncbi:MAG: tetratricopeptide repeat protein [Deltaproteobacteria bacterium]
MPLLHTQIAIRFALALATGGAAPSRPAPATIERGVALYESFDSTEARQVFEAVLAANPPLHEQALAHVYLGILAFDRLDIGAARHELEAALTADPAMELPLGSSPKLRALFSQVRQRVYASWSSVPSEGVRSVHSEPRRGVLPEAPVESVTAPAAQPRSHLPAALAIAGGATAALGLGAGLLSSWSLAQAQASPDVAGARAYQAACGWERVAADGLFGAGATLGLAALIALAIGP